MATKRQGKWCKAGALADGQGSAGRESGRRERKGEGRGNERGRGREGEGRNVECRKTL